MIPKDKTRMTLTLSDDLAEWIDEESQKFGVTKSAMVTIALRHYMDMQKGMQIVKQSGGLIEVVNQLKNAIDQAKNQ